VFRAVIGAPELRELARIVRKLPDEQRPEVAHLFARELAALNPRFDHRRWYAACGIVILDYGPAGT
jgi:hypothetical protein